VQSVENKILTRIKRSRKGTLFFPDNFHAYGTSDAVRLALHRLVKKGELVRVAHGMYSRPRVVPLFGELRASAEEVAAVIARRDRIRTIPTGAYALNALGLSTQVPLNIVLLTDGSPRTIKVGGRTIRLKKTAPKNLMAKGRISGLVIQALKEIGKDRQTRQDEQKIIDLLRKEKPGALKHDIALAPEWIRKIMMKALE
jgi:hypothetical protein